MSTFSWWYIEVGEKETKLPATISPRDRLASYDVEDDDEDEEDPFEEVEVEDEDAELLWTSTVQ